MKIVGNLVGTTLPKPNFKQTDPTKGDYIKGKPNLKALAEKDIVEREDLNDDILLSLDKADAAMVSVDELSYAMGQKAQVQIITWGDDD